MKITVTPGLVRRQLETVSRITTKSAILGESLSGKELASIASLYPKWKAGLSVVVDDIYRVQNTLYKVVQAHTTQADWTPPTVPALFTPVAAAGVIPEWVQPTGAQDAYAVGDQVTHDNPQDGGNVWLYESKIPANTTQPGRDSTFDRYWQPVEAVRQLKRLARSSGALQV